MLKSDQAVHKKDQVKEVIEKYIKKGRDFFELTPSFLENLDELNGFSERTLKRGRTEFKLEHPEMIKKHSRNTANLKKKVFKYLEKAPKATPKELNILFPEIDKKLLVNIRNLWKKENQEVDSEEEAHSLRQNVFDFLEQAPQTTLSKLEKAFPDFNKKTISNYLDQWRKEHTPKRKVSLKQRIMDYLDTNANTDLPQLRAYFSDTKPASINTYYSLWKNNRIQNVSPKASRQESQLEIRSGDSDIVQALKTTIDAQKKTIDVLKSQNEILRDRQNIKFPELEGMTKDEVKTVERVIRVFIRGIKSN
ncbi:MAG: hypothetical protein ABIK68_16670 [bacterium]